MKTTVRCRKCGLIVTLLPRETPFTCVCGAIVDSEGKVLGKRPKPKPRAPCQHLGESTRQQECDSCKGKVQIKIFTCAIHGECALAKKLDGLACCTGCKDYEPNP